MASWAGTVLLDEPGPLPFARHLSPASLGRLLSAARLRADAQLLWTEWTQGASLTSLYQVLRVVIQFRRAAETKIFMQALRLRSDRIAELHSVDKAVCFSQHLCFPLDDDEPLFACGARVRAASITRWILRHMQPVDCVRCIPGRVFDLDPVGLQVLLHVCGDVVHKHHVQVNVSELFDFCTELVATPSCARLRAAKTFVLLCMLQAGKHAPGLVWL